MENDIKMDDTHCSSPDVSPSKKHKKEKENINPENNERHKSRSNSKPSSEGEMTPTSLDRSRSHTPKDHRHSPSKDLCSSRGSSADSTKAKRKSVEAADCYKNYARQPPPLDIDVIADYTMEELQKMASEYNIEAPSDDQGLLLEQIIEAAWIKADRLFGAGVLDIQQSNFGFLRTNLTNKQDIYISQSQIRKFHLNNNDRVATEVFPPNRAQFSCSVQTILLVNNIPASKWLKQIHDGGDPQIDNLPLEQLQKEVCEILNKIGLPLTCFPGIPVRRDSYILGYDPSINKVGGGCRGYVNLPPSPPPYKFRRKSISGQYHRHSTYERGESTPRNEYVYKRNQRRRYSPTYSHPMKNGFPMNMPDMHRGMKRYDDQRYNERYDRGRRPQREFFHNRTLDNRVDKNRVVREVNRDKDNDEYKERFSKDYK